MASAERASVGSALDILAISAASALRSGVPCEQRSPGKRRAAPARTQLNWKGTTTAVQAEYTKQAQEQSLQTQPATSRQATPRSKASRISSDSWQRNWTACPEADQARQAQRAAGKTTKPKRSRDSMPVQTALLVFHAMPLRILLRTSILPKLLPRLSHHYLHRR